MPRSPLEKEIELLFQKHEAVVRNHFLVKPIIGTRIQLFHSESHGLRLFDERPEILLMYEPILVGAHK